jgi:hypothetical protein
LAALARARQSVAGKGRKSLDGNGDYPHCRGMGIVLAGVFGRLEAD